MSDTRLAPAELSIWFSHHSVLCSTLYTKLLCKTVGAVLMLNHTLKGKTGICACAYASVSICLKALSWARLTTSGSLDVFMLWTKITKDQLQPLMIRHVWLKKTLCGKHNYTVCFACVYVCVCDTKVRNSDLVSSCFCWGIMGKCLQF